MLRATGPRASSFTNCFNLWRIHWIQVPLKETECTQCEHKPIYGRLHRRQHIYGALPIQSGERINLIIIWMRSSAVRSKLRPMCNRVPRLVPSFRWSGDGFTVNPGSLKIICWFYCANSFWEQVQNFRSLVTNRLTSAINCDSWWSWSQHIARMLWSCAKHAEYTTRYFYLQKIDMIN